MSNATQDSRNSGEHRRRRSRGGRNRRKNNNPNAQGGQQRQNQGQRSEEFRPKGPRPPRRRAPVKLSWWQKLLKAIGLYKEPVRPPRPERKADAVAASEPKAPKSNTRNVRTGEVREPREPRESREPREGKRGRTNRSGERPRGGDSSTVESARVYVGNLSYDVTEQDLQELFKGIGGVRNVEIVYNRTTHRSKGYGFVEMLHVDEAKRSVEVLHDQFFMGRKLNVSGAKSKGQDEREEKGEEIAAKPVELAPLPAAEVSTEAEALEARQEAAIESAAANVEAVGAPPEIVEAVEHAVADAVVEEAAAPSEEEKQA